MVFEEVGSRRPEVQPSVRECVLGVDRESDFTSTDTALLSQDTSNEDTSRY